MNKSVKKDIENQMHLTQSQLIRYSEGVMNEAEMHQVEMHLLSCALCSEALEGIELMVVRKKKPAMESLHSRFRARMRREKRAPKVAYWKWAAIAAIFLLSSTALFVLLNNDIISEKEIATQESKRKENIPEVASEPLVELKRDSTILNNSFITDEVIAVNGKDDAPSGSAKRVVLIPETSFFSEASPPGRKEESAAAVDFLDKEVVESIAFREKNLSAGLEIDSQASDSREVGKMAAKRTRGVKLEETAAYANQKEISGKILDSAGDPVPGASIIIKGSAEGTISDIQGEYSLRVPDSSSSLQISAIGYTSEEIEIHDTATHLTSTLYSDVMTLSEVVVVAYGTQKKQNVTGAVASVKPDKQPRPKNGNKKFNKYIQKNLITEEAAETGVEGILTVSFFVGRDGSVGDFKIISPVGYGLDEKAIELITNGPEWIREASDNTSVKEQVILRIPVTIKKK